MALSLYKMGRGRRGGAGDINTFRKRVDYNALPDVSDITYEGLFNEYYFDTLSNIKNDDEKQYSKEEQLIIPTYCFAKCKPPKSLQLARQLSTETPSTSNGNAWEYYMNVGLNENFDVNKMKRNKLNLMIVLDNSGSMGSSFDRSSSETKMIVANKAVIALFAHLTEEDRLGVISFNSDFTVIQPMTLVKDIKMKELEKNILSIRDTGGTNMEIAYNAATSCFKQLFETVTKKERAAKTDDGGDTATPDDHKEGNDSDDKEQRMGWKANSECKIYSDSANKWFDGTVIKVTNDKEGEWLTVAYRTGANKTPTLKQIQRFATEIKAKEAAFEPNEEYANRIIFLTDAQPNASSGKDSLLDMVKRNSSTDQYKGYQIHTTFIGVGLDFNTAFIEDIIKVPGGNYYAVHSNEQFMKTMAEEFKFMVTPIVFNFVLSLMAEGNACCIEEAYGTGDDDAAVVDNGEVMNVKSMFPSQHDADDQVKGGVVVLKLKNDVDGKKDVSYHMEIRAAYKDVDGKRYKLENNVVFGGGEDNLNLKKDEEYYDNSGIRKALLLVRYVQLLKLWMKYQKKQKEKNKVTQEYKEIIKQFIAHFKSEMDVIADKTLQKELKILNTLIKK
eukprot:592081_1